MKKIKWNNVIKSIVLMFCILVMLHDVYMITIYCWIANRLCQIAIFGLLTFMLVCSLSVFIIDDFIEQTKSIQTNRPKFRKDTINNLN